MSHSLNTFLKLPSPPCFNFRCSQPQQSNTIRKRIPRPKPPGPKYNIQTALSSTQPLGVKDSDSLVVMDSKPGANSTVFSELSFTLPSCPSNCILPALPLQVIPVAAGLCCSSPDPCSNMLFPCHQPNPPILHSTLVHLPSCTMMVTPRRLKGRLVEEAATRLFDLNSPLNSPNPHPPSNSLVFPRFNAFAAAENFRVAARPLKLEPRSAVVPAGTICRGNTIAFSNLVVRRRQPHAPQFLSNLIQPMPPTFGVWSLCHNSSTQLPLGDIDA